MENGKLINDIVAEIISKITMMALGDGYDIRWSQDFDVHGLLSFELTKGVYSISQYVSIDEVTFNKNTSDYIASHLYGSIEPKLKKIT